MSLNGSISSEQQRPRSSPWCDTSHPNPPSESETGSFKVSGGSPSSPNFLGPIGPPSRHTKPSAPLSPKTQQGSPQQCIQSSPAPRSPLLGPAPSSGGLLPLPDKGIYKLSM